MRRRLGLIAVLVFAIAGSSACAVVDRLTGPDAGDYFDATSVEILKAAGRGDVDAIRAKVAAGADINARSNDHDSRRAGITVLQFAAEYGRPRTVTTLMNAGADPLVMTSGKYNAPAYAILRGRTDSLRAMLDARPSLVDAPDRLGSNIVDTAVLNRDRAALRLLIDRHANLDVPQTVSGWTPLFTAAAINDVDTCRLLIRLGADGGHRGRHGTFLKLLYTGNDSIMTASFLRGRAALEQDLRERGFPVETGR